VTGDGVERVGVDLSCYPPGVDQRMVDVPQHKSGSDHLLTPFRRALVSIVTRVRVEAYCPDGYGRMSPLPLRVCCVVRNRSRKSWARR